MEKAEEVLADASGDRLNVPGMFQADIFWRGQTSHQTCYVVSPLRHVLLGLPALEELGVKFVDSVAHKEPSYEVLYPQVFNNLGTMPGEYTIRLKPDAVP